MSLLKAAATFSTAEVCQIMVQTAHGLWMDFHRHGFLHNSLKADNIRVLSKTKVGISIPHVYMCMYRHMPKTICWLEDNV